MQSAQGSNCSCILCLLQHFLLKTEYNEWFESVFDQPIVTSSFEVLRFVYFRTVGIVTSNSRPCFWLVFPGRKELARVSALVVASLVNVIKTPALSAMFDE